MKKRIISGMGWLGLLRITSQIFVFIKLGILTRILTPEDFGIFALVTTSINSIEALSESGFNYAAVYYRDSFRKYAPTLFFLNVLRGIVLFMLLVILANPIGYFFSDQKVSEILYIAALVPLIKGFVNPYTLLFYKNQKFNIEFFFRIVPVLIATVSTIYFGLIYKNVYGLTYGLLMGSFSEVVISYLIIRGKIIEKPNLKIFIKLFKFGRWMSASSIFLFLNSQIDSFFVGKVFGTYILGLYDIAFKLATIVTTEISDTLAKVLFPYFSSIQNNKNKIMENYLKSVALLSIPALITLLLFISVPEFIITIAFGDQWLKAAPLLSILAIYGFARSIVGPIGPLFLASGKPHLLAFTTILNFILILVLIIPLSGIFGIIGVAYAMTLSYIVIAIINFVIIKKNFNLKI